MQPPELTPPATPGGSLIRAMSTSFLLVLRECPPPARPGVAAFLSRAFGLKDTTCASIAESTPITLVNELASAEAAAGFLALSAINRLGGKLELAPGPGDELPKIDWPKRPQLFRRDLADHVADLQIQVPFGDGSHTPLITLVAAAVGLGPPAPGTGSASPHAKPAEFKGIQLPEITPFGGMAALPPATTPPVPGTRTAQKPQPAPQPAPHQAAAHSHPLPGAGSDETLARLNELFPEEESSGFLPNNQDITSILDKLLPDEGGPTAPQPGSASSSRRAVAATLGNTGFAVFLAKIADEGRRQKAVELIAELAKIPKEEAEALSKKVIIPVLKGATKDEAEGAKQRFAKIGILARVKGPE
jgi:hypothetical protein